MTIPSKFMRMEAYKIYPLEEQRRYWELTLLEADENGWLPMCLAIMEDEGIERAMEIVEECIAGTPDIPEDWAECFYNGLLYFQSIGSLCGEALLNTN